MADIGVPELLIILAIILILFGPSRLAGAGAALGQAIRGFRQALRRDDPTSPDVVSDETQSNVAKG